MVKGCQKRVVFMKNTGSEFFDEAYFVITESHIGRDDGEMISEANRIIDSARDGVRGQTIGRAACSLIAFAAGSLLTALSVFIFNTVF